MYHFNHSQVNNLVALIFTMLGNHHYYLPAEHVHLSCTTKILYLIPKLCSPRPRTHNSMPMHMYVFLSQAYFI